MKLFLDSSVVIAACGSSSGASYHVAELSRTHHWDLQVSTYVIQEVEHNLWVEAWDHWNQLRALLRLVPDILVFPWSAVFPPAKDRPILYTAFASADVLLTLDRVDFQSLMGKHFYGLPIMEPAEFLECERSAGRL